jgi:hypothetical protein
MSTIIRLQYAQSHFVLEKIMSDAQFYADAQRGALNKEQRELLSRKICDLPLQIKDSRLELLINRLYQELEKKGIQFKPGTYLADEWGCPQGVPVIGIPFYLANRELSRLEGQLTGIEAESEEEVMMDLRHEAGHAFNYAYRLYSQPEWQRLFGQFSSPYREDYKPIPFSARYVRHLPGWYAQKHPDEDFAETFAVWLTPDSDWQNQYADTPVMSKLMYVDKAAAQYGSKPPPKFDEILDSPVQELTMTLGKWYEPGQSGRLVNFNLQSALNNDIKRLFPSPVGQPAAEILAAQRAYLILEVNRWTGINRRLLGVLVDKLLERIKSLDLKMKPEQTSEQLMSMSIFVTTLAMNYVHKGQFVET